MRIAIIASPRCGNNWVRRVMSDALGYPHYAAHTIADFPEELPLNCILNIHALNSGANQKFFTSKACKILVLARHPLDIFVSVLQFARREPAVHKWLDGMCEIPDDTSSLAPNDPKFVQWMCGTGAKRLLSVSLGWSTDPATLLCVKYEDLIKNPEARFLAIFDELGVEPVNQTAAALQAYPVTYFAQFKNHGWMGERDNYLKFLTQDTCRVTRDAHADYFRTLEYKIGENAALTLADANRRYHEALPD